MPEVCGGGERDKKMITPDKCLICGADYSGGAALPGGPLPEGLRVFYQCGASLSYCIIGQGVYSILFKNCYTDFKEIYETIP